MSCAQCCRTFIHLTGEDIYNETEQINQERNLFNLDTRCRRYKKYKNHIRTFFCKNEQFKSYWYHIAMLSYQ